MEVTVDLVMYTTCMLTNILIRQATDRGRWHDWGDQFVAKIHTLLILVDARNQISSVIEVYLQFLKISR